MTEPVVGGLLVGVTILMTFWFFGGVITSKKGSTLGALGDGLKAGVMMVIFWAVVGAGSFVVLLAISRGCEMVG